MSNEEAEFERTMHVRAEARQLLGSRAWQLLEVYGKLMHGPNAGLYVSGIAVELRLDLARQLVAGKTVKVHLMHKHRSGHYEASSLRMQDGHLVMVFGDREELA